MNQHTPTDALASLLTVACCTHTPFFAALWRARALLHTSSILRCSMACSCLQGACAPRHFITHSLIILSSSSPYSPAAASARPHGRQHAAGSLTSIRTPPPPCAAANEPAHARRCPRLASASGYGPAMSRRPPPHERAACASPPCCTRPPISAAPWRTRACKVRVHHVIHHTLLVPVLHRYQDHGRWRAIGSLTNNRTPNLVCL